MNAGQFSIALGSMMRTLSEGEGMLGSREIKERDIATSLNAKYAPLLISAVEANTMSRCSVCAAQLLHTEHNYTPNLSGSHLC